MTTDNNISFSIKAEPDAFDTPNDGVNWGSVVYNTNDSYHLDELLKSFNLVEVKPYLTRAEITFESLKYLSKDDIKEAIPPIGLRACFRAKLFSWRKDEYGIDDETLSEKITNKVASWLHNSANDATPTPTSSFYTPVGNCKLSKSLRLVLEDCLKGKSLISYFEKNGYLTDLLRADLINIILEDIFYHHAKLSPKDMSAIVDEISENFPNEIREFYFIPRGRKANPGGKLWDKYVNQRSKRTKLLPKSKEDVEASDASITNLEFDESLLLPIKESLSGDLSNWDEVKNKWQQTYLLRRKELKTSKDIFEFLLSWPLFSNSRSEELINIDFELKYPNKKQILFNKWNEFTQKIKTYYYLHVKDKKSKEILAYSNDTTNKSSLDFIYTILLNSVILPTARFSNEAGKSSQKITIPDANESFIIHLNTINEYEKAIQGVKEKYFSKGLTAQPFIIAVGLSIYNLEEFYIYFYNTLFKFDSFLQSLDICFKIMHVLSLEYPKGCQGPWLFIQEYFYEIKLANDFKLSSIYQVINYLKTK